MTVESISLGCRLNFAESDTIARSAPAGEDWIVVNSCAVTNEAVRQTRQAIRHAHGRRPDAKILVTGCAAELEPEAFVERIRAYAHLGYFRPDEQDAIIDVVRAADASAAHDVLRRFVAEFG